jgi:hypothetical protein
MNGFYSLRGSQFRRRSFMEKEVQLVNAEWEAGGVIHLQVTQLVAADNAAGGVRDFGWRTWVGGLDG